MSTIPFATKDLTKLPKNTIKLPSQLPAPAGLKTEIPPESSIQLDDPSAIATYYYELGNHEVAFYFYSIAASLGDICSIAIYAIAVENSDSNYYIAELAQLALCEELPNEFGTISKMSVMYTELYKKLINGPSNDLEFYNNMLNWALILCNPVKPLVSFGFLSYCYKQEHFRLAGRLFSLYYYKQMNDLIYHPGLFMSAYSYLFTANSMNRELQIAKSCMLLVLLLVCENAEFTNSWSSDFSMSSSQSITPFENVYQNIISDIDNQGEILLLHKLLVNNNEFKLFVQSKSDSEQLILPLLKIIVNNVDEKRFSPILYSVLDVIIILSLDDIYFTNLHRKVISTPIWVQERNVKKISIGGLVILIILRLLYTNLKSTHDIYINSAGVAILNNLASSTVDIESIVCSKILNFFEHLVKKYTKWVETGFQESTELFVYSDLIASILEFINAIITLNIQKNPQLMYTLLQHIEMFSKLANIERFESLISNIKMVLRHIQDKIDTAQFEIPTVEILLAVVQDACLTWNPPNFEKIPTIKFNLVQDPKYQDYFRPILTEILQIHYISLKKK